MTAEAALGAGAPGPQASASDLAAWVASATSKGLPDPCRDRWQPLRAGVVNLWEFGADEYWFADGRAQLSGRNQSGKSTLMALTTLILLTGTLDRRNLDTFGKDQKSFRYYVEPTSGDDDRRDDSAAAHRGWAWIEYGRVTADGPRFFTCLLYAEARRGSQNLNRRWLTARDVRVRGDLRLHDGNAVTAAKDVEVVEGVTAHRDGREYADAIASRLFGFADPDRLATLTAMLRVLRQPHLGQQLNPDSFTQQMRTALPEVDPAEVAQLADGWEQLDRLADDRDAAERARAAVEGFVRTRYNPWADAVLRARGDALTAANTAFDKVTRDVGQARRTLEAASEERAELERRIGVLEQAHREAVTAHRHLSESAEVRDVRARAVRVEELRRSMGAAEEALARIGLDLNRARERAVAAEQRMRTQQQRLDVALRALEEHTTLLVAMLPATGLPVDAEGWVRSGDIARMRASIRERLGHVAALEQLARVHAKAADALGDAQEAGAQARTRHSEAAEAAAAAAAGWQGAVQAVSDDVESWGARVASRLSELTADEDPDGVAPEPPDFALRRAWVDVAITAAESGARTLRLRTDVAAGWSEPCLGRIRAAVAGHLAEAGRRGTLAAGCDAEADALLAQADLVPPPPTAWSRRERPVAGADGAPLWMLLDPVEGAPVDVLEATLAAAGVLDTWVSPDGRWRSERDGDDAVLTISSHPAPSGWPTLGAFCRVGDDAGALAGHADGVLRAVAVVDAGADLPDDATVAVSLDGRWRTPQASGRAGVVAQGASYLGTAARAAARARRVQELRDEASAHRDEAARERALAATGERLAAIVGELVASSPDDQALVEAAVARRDADAVAVRAEAALREAEAREQRCATAADEAHARLFRFATEHGLPPTEERARDVRAALDRVTDALHEHTARLSGHREAGSAADAERERREEADEALQDVAASHAAAEADAQRARTAYRTESDALTRDDQDLLARVEAFDVAAREAEVQLRGALDRREPLSVDVSKAQGVLDDAEARREAADLERQGALEAFWVPVRAGLAGARGLEAPEDDRITAALDLARRARAALTPKQWPDDPRERERRVLTLWTSVTKQVAETRVTLEEAGGRSIAIVLPGEDAAEGTDDTDRLPAVVVTVDSSGTAWTPWEAAERLRVQVEELSDEHDSKLAEVLTDLLASTFLDHLRTRARKVDDLLAGINTVLEAHPTGATQVVLRLRMQAPEGLGEAYGVVRALTREFLEDPAVQERISEFLHAQVRQAQEQARAAGDDWKERLAQLLDYRAWFDVVVDRKVKGGAWRPLTRAAHDVDSGGGKAVTLLQPLLATLVALYDEADGAPRPVWLDEAFAGIDDANRVQVLRLFREFDLDFLFAGPGTLVAAPVVPAAAIWSVNRAPAPMAGVDLSLTLWTGADRTARALETDFSQNLPVPRAHEVPDESLLSLNFDA